MNTRKNQSASLLALLRGLVPRRSLSYLEAERIAELQANRFREVLGVSQAKLPEETISELPRLCVRRRYDIPVSGLTYWDKGRWLIALNAHEPVGRQRFSLAHELKHVLDHTTLQYQFHDRSYFSAEEQAERIADYFAGCLLMPKRHVKRLFGERLSLIRMADAFGVSFQAMHVRQSQLGLTEPTPRCDWVRHSNDERSIYLRRLPVVRAAENDLPEAA